MQFWKMNGAGNDFVIINNMDGNLPPEVYSDMARTVCERHLSVGADGFMVVEQPRKDGDYRMCFFNSDGSIGEMCGNGARCIGRYGHENGLAGETQRIETTAGLVISRRLSAEQYKVRLNDPTTMDLDRSITIRTGGEDRSITCDYVELGDPGLPHAVVPIKGLADYPEQELFELGRAIRWYSGFPKGANVNFYEIIGPDHVLEKTFERGVEGFTYACGTGTGSVVAALTAKGLVSGEHVAVDMRGGTLFIDIGNKAPAGGLLSDVFLTGPTNIVAVGELRDQNVTGLIG